MAAFTLNLLAQLPEAYQAFSPLIDILPLIPVCSSCCLPSSGRPPSVSADQRPFRTAQANAGNESIRLQRVGS